MLPALFYVRYKDALMGGAPPRNHDPEFTRNATLLLPLSSRLLIDVQYSCNILPSYALTRKHSLTITLRTQYNQGP